MSGRRKSGRVARYWTEAELAVANRHAELLHDGKHRLVKHAAAACMCELAKKCPTGNRTVVAVMDRIRQLRRARGDNLQPALWTEAELAVVNRFARAYGEGRYAWMVDVVPDCRAELERLRLDRGSKTSCLVRRTDNSVSAKLHHCRKDLGIRVWLHGWTDAELRTVGRYARAVAEGKYNSSRAAAPDCKAALDRQREAGSTPDRRRPARSRNNVLTRLLEGAWSFRPARKIVHWTDVELKTVDRYVRRLMKGSLETMSDAARKCADELGRKTGPDASKDGPRIRRSALAVQFCLYVRLHHAGQMVKGKAGWSPEEYAIRDRVVRKWKRSRAKGQPWHRQEAAHRLRKRLRARGFERTSVACWAMAQDGTRPYPDRT